MELIMTFVRSALLCVSMLATVSGCGQDRAPEEPPSPPPVKDTVFKDMSGAMDKARSVEGTTMQQKENMDRAVQEAEGR
jgi:outer membrane lipoprotein-sorting protein